MIGRVKGRRNQAVAAFLVRERFVALGHPDANFGSGFCSLAHPCKSAIGQTAGRNALDNVEHAKVLGRSFLVVVTTEIGVAYTFRGSGKRDLIYVTLFAPDVPQVVSPSVEPCRDGLP